MVAESPTSPPDSPAAESPSEAPPIRNRSSLRRLLLSLLRITDLQSKIILLRAKLTVQRIALFLALLAVATLVALLAIIFVYIGVFKILTWYLNPAWAYLLYGAFHFLSAALLFLLARRTLHSPTEKPSPPTTNDQGPPPIN